jgi:hypothetical protein
MKKQNVLGIAIVLVACAPAVGCARDSAPNPTPAPTSETVLSEQASLVQGDVAPRQLYKLTPKIDLAGGIVATSLPTSPKVPFALPARPETKTFKQMVVAVPAGSSAGEVALPVDEATDAAVYVQVKDPAATEAISKDQQILAPGGKVRVDLAVPKLGLEAKVPAKATETKSLTSFTLASGAAKGEYVFRYGSIAAKSGVAFEVRMPSSPIAMDVTPSAGQFLLGDTATVAIKLMDGDKPLTGAKLACELVRPDGTKGASVPYREIGDGLYEALVSNVLGLADATGAYNLDVKATGTNAAGTRYQRTGYTAFGFAIPTARIVSAAAPRTVKDGSGSVTAFETDVTVETAAADRYELSATLVAPMPDGTERPVAEAQTTATLAEGKHTVTLRFDAGYVALTKLEGAFVVRGLRLYSLGTNALYHRLGRGLDLRFASVKTTELLPLKEISPAIDQMVMDGEFDLVK